MKIINATSFNVIAYATVHDCEYGPDVVIKPGESGELIGPYVGKIRGRACFRIIDVPTIICTEKPDDLLGNNIFHVEKGGQLYLEVMKIQVLKIGDVSVTVRHHEDAVEQCVKEWRESNPSPSVPVI